MWSLKNFLFVLCFIFIPISTFSAEKKCVIIASARLRPYIETVEGIKKILSKKITTYFLDDNLVFVKQQIQTKKWHIVIAIGRKSIEFIKDNKIHSNYYIYSLAVYPENIYKCDKFSCGIYLIIPPKIILSIIKSKLPSIHTILIPFSIKESKNYALEIKKIASKFSINIKLLELKDKDILLSLKKNIKNFDSILFIPDPVFYSKEVASFMIEQALLYNKIVIGYNRFFLEQGALLCFVVDFKKTGEKTAYLVKKILSQQNCLSDFAVFKIEINKEVYRYFYKKYID